MIDVFLLVFSILAVTCWVLGLGIRRTPAKPLFDKSKLVYKDGDNT